ncbi:hypothetical protein A1F97_08671 [Pyrenophora tritici-repentis]|uniref:Uncharacterized protein n=3 Tax=Pyrenophora tritici-repentis TaxID=45151 RepID=A0A2W1HJN8_9PLEO|nr:uncharacterized protein PTRG_06725 [Pyrenophora tritici-repentis Pt-1C-BFP]KAI0574771.1 hypothetical protein Alg215_08406 [Pyrenophora tritici-repentis]EDU49645.1 hypothetical protein PTRG_06725 [Pyrenophora tritici-repentis Pt-1C-BFP]KAI1509759.1 hypothetical protein Ptr86124_011345 [Pyrenophora tritici-repentis]KAI1529588.1 hypothetical protein PtrSN001A_008524 [Pyrenophora tritici-repentis]KAI1531193.1 hypothetical protein PtrSN001C_008416 [Pyrenophora tritici-repentis]
MGTIFDALTARRLRGSLQTLLSPHQTRPDESERSYPRYVCARKSHSSGRKGRISVYRVRGKYPSEHGQIAKLYSNVRGADLDEDERGSFAGVKRISSEGRGRRVRQKMDQAADKLKKNKGKAKTLAIKTAKPRDAGPIKRAKGNGTAQSEDFAQDEISTAEPSAEHALRQEIQRSVQQELALSTSKDQFGRQLVPTVAKPSKKGQQAAASRGTKVVKDGRHNQKKVFRDRRQDSDSSIVLEATATSFRQPGMTSQDSDALVFGVGSQRIPRSDLRADLMHDCITPDVHTHASQTPEDDRLVEVDGQQTDLSNLSQKLLALNLQRLTSSLGAAEKPTTSLPPVLSTVSKSKLRFGKVAPTVPRDIQPRRPRFDPYGDDDETVSGEQTADASRYLPLQRLQQSPSASTHVHYLDPINRDPQTDTPPGSPPYKSN